MKFDILYEVGSIPRKVALGFRSDRGDRLYLRWRIPGNWKLEATALRGRDPETVAAARKLADHKLADILVALPTAGSTAAAGLTLRAGLQLALDPDIGKYPVATLHRAEVEREVERAAVILKDKPFALLEVEDFTRLWRTRIRQLQSEGKSGHRMAELLVQRVLAVGAWLRERKRIPLGACHAPKGWKQALRDDWRQIAGQAKDYEPARPRHTVDELRKILAVAGRVDPRFALLLQLGAELRLGQIARAKRSDLDLDEGTFQPRGAGKKRTPKVILTAGQGEAIARAFGEAGYLRALELRWRHDGVDYPLFPGRRLSHGVATHADAASLTRAAWDRWFAEAEGLAEVPHCRGRGPYGLRRAGVDGAKARKAGREDLKEFGGWSDTATPDQIYADQEAGAARQRAADLRADIRGETPKITTDVTTPDSEARNP